VILYLLDTNTVSYIVKGKSPAARLRLEKVALRRDREVAISAITAGEIFYGLARIGAGAQRRKAMDAFLSGLTLHPWNHAAAEAYGDLRARQEAHGKALGPYDMQIAAHALALKAILVSHDRAFRHVTGLSGLEDWANDI
jgi:tRNA(fMet)-specific endonuclease VapC